MRHTLGCPVPNPPMQPDNRYMRVSRIFLPMPITPVRHRCSLQITVILLTIFSHSTVQTDNSRCAILYNGPLTGQSYTINYTVRSCLCPRLSGMSGCAFSARLCLKLVLCLFSVLCCCFQQLGWHIKALLACSFLPPHHTYALLCSGL